MHDFTPFIWAVAFAVTILAGFVKGTVGFAMPMVMISGLGSLVAPEVALSALIIPTVLTNAVQALRNGSRAAIESARHHWRYILVIVVMIGFSAQLVTVLPTRALYLIIGTPVTLFAIAQLAGLRLSIPPRRRIPAEVGFAGFAGFVGGLSGVWGPPTALYLTALETPKMEQMRTQGIVYGFASIALLLAHIQSGVLSRESAAFSTLFIIPSMIGIAIGFYVTDRLDQDKFRRATLAVLVIAGLNLVRRGVMG
ncbi:sulfite exporter TauE/SafE family protein [Acuticoccus sp. M5D2P5]|uniref:sulfite exporter TauE/SafE family protein n=1 Tax=Acuticoccus kalidii TaxID=2910977 RepID=UPI001F3DC154|nr:sulfite exporter TauE/SafE family protein [Acuticoccus kalidii]MCF3935914.1 sulfite exporter TauE/SafE family protein [Acuticoccus kalidii]